MLKRFLRLKVSVPIAAVALGGGGLFALNALADYTPPALVDSQTFPVAIRTRRLTATTWACRGMCRTAQTGGTAPRFCWLNLADQTGAADVAAAACGTAAKNACTPQAVDDCASGERQ